MRQFFIFIVAICLFVPSYLYGQNPKPSTKEIYELQEKCGKQATALFKKEYGTGYDKSEAGTLISSFTNHYNVKLNKCFVLINSNSVSKSNNDTLIMKDLWDINDNKNCGSMVRWRKQNNPMNCSVDNRICKSEGEWDSLVKPYMEN